MSKQLLIFIFYFFLQINLFAGEKISYLYEDVSIGLIADTTIEWQELNEPIYNGFENGVYWFKIVLPPSIHDRIISIPESHISRARLFVNGQEISMEQPARYVKFSIDVSEKEATYYLRVNCLLEARIPLEIEDAKAYYSQELIEYLIIGAYMGMVVAIIIFSLLSYFSLGNVTYLLYILMVIGMSGNAFYKDGVLAYFIGVNSINEILEPFINLIVPMSAILFTVNYLDIKGRLKKLRVFGVSMTFFALLSALYYLYTRSFVVFTATAILNLLSLSIFLSAGFILWNKSPFSRFFAIAYGIPLFFAYDYYISPHFGIKILDLHHNIYKVGSTIEMLIFIYAIMFQAKHMNMEHEEARRKLTVYIKSLEQEKKGLNERPDTTKELIEKFSLTLKEIEILKVLSLNKTNKEIAADQFISENTVKYHIKNILKKLDVNSKEGAKYRYLNYSDEMVLPS